MKTYEWAVDLISTDNFRVGMISELSVRCKRHGIKGVIYANYPDKKF